MVIFAKNIKIKNFISKIWIKYIALIEHQTAEDARICQISRPCVYLFHDNSRGGVHGLNWYELLSISVLGVLEMQGSLTQVGVSAVDVSLTQLTPFRSRTFTPIEIISFSKTFCVATWLNYTPFAPCGHRKSRAIKKIAVYISRIFQNSTFKPWFFVVQKINL